MCKIYSYRYCCFTGNGTIAMYLLFLALNGQKKKILYPAISCTNPVNASLYAGYEHEFCGVNLFDYAIDLESMKKKLQTNGVGIVVPTHIYGHQYNRRKIREICRYYGAFVVEDAAQTIDIGESDAAIVSFGQSKIFESSLGGGAVFSNDLHLHNEIKKQKKNIKYKPDFAEYLFEEYRNIYYDL